MSFVKGQELMLLGEPNGNSERLGIPCIYIGIVRNSPLHKVMIDYRTLEVDINNLVDAQSYWDETNLKDNSPAYVGGYSISEAVAKRIEGK